MTALHPFDRLDVVLLVAAGGFAGASARYSVDQLTASSLGGTLAVNVLGSFALGLLLYRATRTGDVGNRVRIGVGTGFLSSFTTYSTLITDLVITAPSLALGYLFASYTLGFGAVVVARACIERISPEGSGP